MIGKLPDNPAQARELVRAGLWTGPTASLASGFVQANLVVLPRQVAFDFLLFCHRNPGPCPLLEVLDPGLFEPREMAPGADLRRDLPRYRIYEDGRLVEEPGDIHYLWREDLVSFLLGCSFTFEAALVEARVPMRHLEQGRNVSMYVTSIQTAPAGIFWGPMVVSMRPIPRGHLVRAVQVTSRYPAVHGAPVHIGDPGDIGIGDLARPDYGDPVEMAPGDVPVFWACGVTPQAIALHRKVPFMITHSPGHMLVTDRRHEDLALP